MKAGDVTDTLELALQASGCDNATVMHKPRLLSQTMVQLHLRRTGRLAPAGMDHVRGAPYHPQTQGKIERWHQTLKNRILLENYFLPGALETQIDAFVDHYNHRRYHESLGNLTPADVYFGRARPSCKGRSFLLREEWRTRYFSGAPGEESPDRPLRPRRSRRQPIPVRSAAERPAKDAWRMPWRGDDRLPLHRARLRQQASCKDRL
jgi:hypothetical protein